MRVLLYNLDTGGIKKYSEYLAKAMKKLNFDEDLESKLDKFLIDIQTALQDEKFFMPLKKDKGRAVAEF